MIAAIALGVLIGVALGSLGGGGSVLAVPVLAHIAGQSAAAATATSLVAVAAASAVGSIGHARVGHVRWGSAATFVATGVAGSWAGATLNGRLDGDALLLAFSALVIVAAYRMLTACPWCTNAGEEQAIREEADIGRREEERVAVATGTTVATPAGARPAARLEANGEPAPAEPVLHGRARVIRLIAAGTLVGFLTGLFGVGGGFVIVPALTLALGLTVQVAIGTSLVVIVGNALVALAFRGTGDVEWDIAIPFSITMLIGSFVGSLVAHRLPPKQSLRAFAVLLVVVAIGNAVIAAVGLLDG